MLTKSALRHTLNNHSIIAILFGVLGSQLIDVPFYMNYTVLGYVWPQNPFLCQLWWYADVGTYQTTIILITWMSFERHILIFHDRLLLIRNTIGALPVNIDPHVISYLLLFDLFSMLFVPIFMILSLPKKYWWKKWREILFSERQQRRIGVNTQMVAIITNRTTKSSPHALT
ncbi:unnamed protein product [Rotaria sp. Silwood2]|nr:unnamed protein product [Rotaria sp. Silwood2]